MQLSTPQTPVMDEQGQNQEVGTQSSFPMWEREAPSLEPSLRPPRLCLISKLESGARTTTEA